MARIKTAEAAASRIGPACALEARDWRSVFTCRRTAAPSGTQKRAAIPHLPQEFREMRWRSAPARLSHCTPVCPSAAARPRPSPRARSTSRSSRRSGFAGAASTARRCCCCGKRASARAPTLGSGLSTRCSRGAWVARTTRARRFDRLSGSANAQAMPAGREFYALCFTLRSWVAVRTSSKRLERARIATPPEGLAGGVVVLGKGQRADPPCG